MKPEKELKSETGNYFCTVILSHWNIRWISITIIKVIYLQSSNNDAQHYLCLGNLSVERFREIELKKKVLMIYVSKANQKTFELKCTYGKWGIRPTEIFSWENNFSSYCIESIQYFFTLSIDNNIVAEI